jgi:hypothetical protein
MQTLQELSYAVLVQNIGTPVSKIKENKSYKMIEKDGLNYVDLGKCIKIDLEYPCYMNDGIGKIHLTFEKNNDHPHLLNHICGTMIFSKSINIIEVIEIEEINIIL